jgi:hypothetical protein
LFLRLIRGGNPPTLVINDRFRPLKGHVTDPEGPAHAPPIFKVLFVVPSVVVPTLTVVLTVIVVDDTAVTRPINVVTLAPSA